MNSCKTRNAEILEYDQLFDEFIHGCKTEEKIGIEYERIPVSTRTQEQATYSGDFGICELLKHFGKNNNWDYIYENENVIGLKKLHDTITLEPGCQFEISLEPQKYISDLKSSIEKIDNALKPLLEEFEISLLNVGVSPKSTYKNIPLIPKKRYHIMANYLWGILSDVMMRETAGIQIGIDFKTEEDAMRKFKLANMMMPFVTAMFANSKYRGGVDTGYLSFRALAWLNTDNERCGFATDFNKDEGFDNYINKLLETPMLYIVRENKYININGKITFKQFLKDGFDGYKPIKNDWLLHSNLYFPEIRLRNFIEIRNHDCVGNGLEYSLPAFYKGIMYSQKAMSDAEELLSKYKISEIKELRFSVARDAINAKLRKKPILELCKELVEISYYTLKNNCDNEEQFLLPLMEMLKKGYCPSLLT